MNKFKKSFEEDNVENQQDALNSAALNRVKTLGGLIGGVPANKGTDIPQDRMDNAKKEMKPYNSEYINRPGSNIGDMVKAGEHVDRMQASEKARQMKDLEDLEMLGAFEEPDSEVNQRAKRLRNILGLK